jgi:hypothetical protein
MDIDSLFYLPYHKIRDTSKIEEKMQQVNSYLEVFNSFVYHQGKFVNLPNVEKGNFYIKDAYVFLCVYYASADKLSKFIEHNLEDSDLPMMNEDDNDVDDEDDEDEEDEKTMECVVYFCQSTQTNKVAYSTFKLYTQNQMENLVDKMYGCKARVELVEYGKEPFAFLAHLENNYVLNIGSRTDPRKDNSKKLYQIRTDFRYATTRAYEIGFDVSTLTSLDLYFLYDSWKGGHVLWKGDSVKQYALDSTFDMIDKLIESNEADQGLSGSHEVPQVNDDDGQDEGNSVLPESCRLIEQGYEPEDFFEYFTNRIESINIPFTRPQFFICNCTTGYFTVHRLLHYTVSDLSPDSCIIIDVGSPDPVYIWIGSESSEIVRKLVNQCALIWLITCRDGREPNIASPTLEKISEELFKDLKSQKRESMQNIKTIHQGNEPEYFKAFFQGWKHGIASEIDPGNSFSRPLKKRSPILFPISI